MVFGSNVGDGMMRWGFWGWGGWLEVWEEVRGFGVEKRCERKGWGLRDVLGIGFGFFFFFGV